MLMLGAVNHPARAAGDGLAEPGVLKVGIIPAEDARAVVKQSKECWTSQQGAEHEDRDLRRLGLQCTDRGAAQRHVDVALMGPFAYMLATTQAPVEAFAVTVIAKTMQPSYHSIIIAREG